MSSVAFDLRSVKGFVVADARGRFVGRVEAPMYGTQPDVPDALAEIRGRGRRSPPTGGGPPREPAPRYPDARSRRRSVAASDHSLGAP